MIILRNHQNICFLCLILGWKQYPHIQSEFPLFREGREGITPTFFLRFIISFKSYTKHVSWCFYSIRSVFITNILFRSLAYIFHSNMTMTLYILGFMRIYLQMRYLYPFLCVKLYARSCFGDMLLLARN